MTGFAEGHASGLAALNNVTTGDAYSRANTLECEGSHRQFIAVTGASIYLRIWQRFKGSIRAGGPGVEIFLPPGYYDRSWQIDRLEVRSAVTGVPAQVTIHAD